jgi:hypothetical protein
MARRRVWYVGNGLRGMVVARCWWEDGWWQEGGEYFRKGQERVEEDMLW